MSFSVFTETQSWLKNSKLNYSAKNILESTNDLAKDEALFVKDLKKIYLADEQSKGRGRGQNTWSSPKSGAALMMTWSFDCEQPPQPVASPLFGLAVYRAIASSFVSVEADTGPLSMKAPNDIYLGAKKVAGLLIEIVKQGSRHRLVVGVGINIFSSPSEILTSGHLSTGLQINSTNWANFLSELDREMTLAAEHSSATALSESSRTEIIRALNLFVGLERPYKSMSPFGDLATDSSIVSWRNL